MANRPASESSSEPRKSRPIVAYLIVLAVVALVPVLAFSGVLLQLNNRAQEEVVKSLALATARAIGQSVDREIQGMATTLKVLSTSPLLTSGDLQTLHDRGEAALAGTGSFIILVDAGYQQLLNTRVPFGTTLGKIADPGSVAEAIRTGNSVISDVVFGKIAKAWVINVALAIKAVDGSDQVLIMTRNAANLAAALVSRQMPNGWHVALLDGNNKIIASSSGARLESGQAFFVPLSTGSIGAEDWQRQRIADQDYVTITAKSALSGWRIVSWAPSATIDQALQTSLLWLIFGGIVTLAAASAATFLLAREISRSVRGLARDARRLGSGEVIAPRDYPISEVADVSLAISAAAQKRHAAEIEVRFLMRELAHRSKNQMTVIAAMAKQSARGADSVPEFVQSFEKRIFGLARSTDLLLANGAAGVDLRELITHQINPFCPLAGERVELSGPPFRLNTQSAQILGMAGHELATNAAKYGAFAGDDGQLRVVWNIRGDRLDFSWREKVKALSTRTERRGFGTTVLESMVGAALGAEVTRTLHPDGIEWVFDVPLAALDPDRTPEADADTDEAKADAAPAQRPADQPTA